MHPMRRRKKRPNYGVRTVEVFRGKNGFGFTISGQQPCILSCIVPNSPAEQAGLRAGDYLVAVCGQNVSKVPHDDVVQLIGSCYGVLKLQIAENYYSDSSEEDFISNTRQKPKYPHKYKANGLSLGENNAEASTSKQEVNVNNLCDVNSTAVCEVKASSNTLPNIDLCPVESDSFVGSNTFSRRFERLSYVCQFIVGYLGTIEMPRKLTPSSRLQIVRGCIKRLRAEKRNYNPVMMTVYTCSLRLKNECDVTLAIYPAGRVTFCGSSNDQNKRHFGVVTTSIGKEPSNSCHVFVTLDATHEEHTKEATKFQIECTPNAITNICEEFPTSSEPIVSSISKFYINRRSVTEEMLVSNSPLPSNASTTTSNSDSGIGFRDDSGHQSDRILVVDIQNQRLHIQAAGESGTKYIDCTKNSSIGENSDFLNSPSFSPSHGNTLHESKSCQDVSNYDGTISCDDYDVRYRMPNQEITVITPEKPVNDEILNKLSPKVFSVNDHLQVSQSLEDLKTQCEESSEDISRKYSLQDLTILAPQNSQNEEHKISPESRVTHWASSFDKLLQDQDGIHTFAEFLKKEVSAENIYFWAACERYRNTEDIQERRKLAQDIYAKYLASDASDSVNVDAAALQITQQQLHLAEPTLLCNAQKQIFSLMKFDSYQRFLKSDSYRNILLKAISGEDSLIPPESLDPGLQIVALSGYLSEKGNEEDLESDRQQRGSRRRRSLLPWSRSRCKSRDRVTQNVKTATSNDNISASTTSLAFWDLAIPSSLCRVILPDSSTAIINIQPQQTAYQIISKLLEKRGLPFTIFQIVLTSSDKVINGADSATVLSGKEVRIEWRIEFILDLPDRTSLTVKSKPSHTLGAVLAPILLRHGYNLQMVTLCLMSENEVLEPTSLIREVDKQRVQVLTRSTPIPNLQGWGNFHDCATKVKHNQTLDEITNRVFEELLHGKAENYRTNQISRSTGSVQSEEKSSDQSSGILGRLLRRDSVAQDKQIRKNKKQLDITDKRHGSKLPQVIAKLKPAAKFEARLEKDMFYEDLKRAQRGRLDDQRGTEINIELPDFLKDKENAPCSRKKLRKIKKDAEGKNILNRELTKNDNESEVNTVDGDIKEYSKEVNTWNNNNEEESSNDAMYVNKNFVYTTSTVAEKKQVDQFPMDPPPLPPKPKNITSWRTINSLNVNQKNIYLDQPTSSFV